MSEVSEREEKERFNQEFPKEYREMLQRTIGQCDIAEIMWMVWMHARRQREES